MEAKESLLKEIKLLWSSETIENFDIAPELLEYLDVKDLENLKLKILESKKSLNDEQKDWLFKFRKYN